MAAVFHAIDAADKAVSRPVFELQLPWLAELALTVPGQWCGMPLSALSLLPLLSAVVATRDTVLAYGAGAVALSLAAVWFTFLIRRGVRKGTDKLVGSSLSLLVVPFVTLGFLAWVGPGEALPAGSFASTCYFTLQLTVAVIKWATLRRRPLHCPNLRLENVRRHVQLARDCEHVGAGIGRYESFPSGDAGSGALFGQVLCMLSSDGASGTIIQNLAYLIAFSASFGRMYFHAHHLGDCIVGVALGCLIPQLLDNWLAWGTFKWWHMAAANAIYVCAQIVARSRTAMPGLGLTIVERENRVRGKQYCDYMQ
eukprot:COSAG02_NODE_8070_length_2721_cov_2.311976_1_plen_311_part_00